MFAIGLAESCGSGTLAVSPVVIQTVGDALVASRTDRCGVPRPERRIAGGMFSFGSHGVY